MKLSRNKILVLAPHTDDVELGCGGTVSRFLREGCNVVSAAFSLAEDASTGFTKSELYGEYMDSCNRLGFTSTNLYEYKVREFQQSRQKILSDMEKLMATYDPDMIFIPSLSDLHQDHQVIATEALRVFKRRTVLCYEVPWNNLSFNNASYIEILQQDLNKKLSALKCYISQARKGYFSQNYVIGLARMRGTQIGKLYAECFEIPRMVI